MLEYCWLDRTLGNKLQRNLHRNLYNLIQENAFENVVWKMTAILSRSQCVKGHNGTHSTTQRTHGVKITSLRRQNDITTSFWRHNYVIFKPCVRWVTVLFAIQIRGKIRITVILFPPTRSLPIFSPATTAQLSYYVQFLVVIIVL